MKMMPRKPLQFVPKSWTRSMNDGAARRASSRAAPGRVVQRGQQLDSPARVVGGGSCASVRDASEYRRGTRSAPNWNARPTRQALRRSASTRRISASAARPTSSWSAAGSRVPSTRWSSVPGSAQRLRAPSCRRCARTRRRPRRPAAAGRERRRAPPATGPGARRARAAAAAPARLDGEHRGHRGASRSGRAPSPRRRRPRRPARRRRSPCARRRGRRRARRRAARTARAAARAPAAPPRRAAPRSARGAAAPAGDAPRRRRASTRGVLERQPRLGQRALDERDHRHASPSRATPRTPGMPSAGRAAAACARRRPRSRRRRSRTAAAQWSGRGQQPVAQRHAAEAQRRSSRQPSVMPSSLRGRSGSSRAAKPRSRDVDALVGAVDQRPDS